MSSPPQTIRWGILATGGIAQTFTRDLLVDPSTRGVHNIKHTVVAASSSSSTSRAQDFLEEVGAPSDAKAYGSYEEFVKDPNIDIVYVATPHSHHYQNARLCLEAGKNVLCEKAFTVNAAQARKLVDIAKTKNLFLMEAVWTRYFPLSIWVRETITSGKLGPIARVTADNSMALNPEQNFPDGKHRMVNPDLAGGALLDLGIYSLTWLFQSLYTTQDPKERQKPVVQAIQKIYTGPNVDGRSSDEHSSIVISFPRSKDAGGDAHGIATTSLVVATDPVPGEHSIPSIRIQGPRGEIQVFPPAFRPTRAKLIISNGPDGKPVVEDKTFPQPGPGSGSGWTNGFGSDRNAEGEGHGMFWEADEAARCILSGQQESATLSWDESIIIMETMDKVREYGGSRFPEKIETLDFPVAL
ncbi:NAD(P)-binding protein [Pseudovirgaria hyperparasitica]|uniref:D-xylose 1-dehydrogenase (NADP(+), D-xylono-1,5-lactone-forming) n=1 Tax=Pseudovirgaria hyperparasitica TaxID=470096 RepID=A0A6A6W7H6_9PEZI|nr:NAD(P)-binding protein [Pseudovirgaria hyperparasitica]KAF2757836.1 NAD(P)-binding protein [Pseudovirgaria hyperparasitica]